MANLILETSIGLVALLLILYFVYLIYNIPSELQSLPRNDIQLPGRVNRSDKIDCDQNITYCFEDAHCARLCSGQAGSICRNGICVNANVINTTVPINECNAERGVFTFFAGNVALGRYDFLCRSVDLGIAPDNPQGQNNMCKDGTIAIDYTRSFPSILDCQCPPGKSLVVLPETSQVRRYAQCIDDATAQRIL
jgi:hypothetical protein